MLLTNDRRLASELCRALLAAAGIAHVWADEGPSDKIASPLVGANESAEATRRFVQSVWSGELQRSRKVTHLCSAEVDQVEITARDRDLGRA